MSTAGIITDLSPWHATCQSCGALIVWARTRKGEPMPVNAETDSHGNILLAKRGDQLHAGVLGRNQAAGARDQGAGLHLSHFANCPHAKRHRKSR